MTTLAKGSRGRAAWGFLLSLVLPGVGHVLARAWVPGLVIVALGWAASLGLRAVLGLAAPTPTGLLVFLTLGLGALVGGIAVAVDAARRIRARPDPGRGPWFRSTWIAALVTIAGGLCIDSVLPTAWESFSIPSGSMAPTLEIGDILMADKRDSRPPLARGQVVIFLLPSDHAINYVKRVIGLPGDHVQVRHGILTLNGTPIPRRPDAKQDTAEGRATTPARHYVETLPGGPSYPILKLTDEGQFNDTPDYLVPPGQLFMMGDNRDNSADSRMQALGPDQLGFVPIANVVATAGTIYWSRTTTRLLSPVR